jgi:hypothetical protein
VQISRCEGWGTAGATSLRVRGVPNVRGPIVIDFRKLAALDIAFLGSRLVVAQFSIGVFGSFALGIFTLLRSHSVGGVALGSYLLFIGINYVPLLVYAIRIVRLDSARDEVAEERAAKHGMFRKYRRQSLLLLVPLAVPILALAHELHHNTSKEHSTPFQRETLAKRHPVLVYFVLTYAISWLGAFLIAVRALVKHEALSKISGLLMFPLTARPEHCRVRPDSESRWKERYPRFISANASPLDSGAMVRCAPDPALPDPDRSPLHESVCVTDFFTRQILGGRRIWDSGRILGRDWLDGLCVPKDVPTTQTTERSDLARSVVGILASSGHRFLGNSYPSRQILGSLLRSLYRCDDGNEGAGRLVVRKH